MCSSDLFFLHLHLTLHFSCTFCRKLIERGSVSMHKENINFFPPTLRFFSRTTKHTTALPHRFYVHSSSRSKFWAFPPKKPLRNPLFGASGVSMGVNSSPNISWIHQSHTDPFKHTNHTQTQSEHSGVKQISMNLYQRKMYRLYYIRQYINVNCIYTNIYQDQTFLNQQVAVL